MCKERQAEPHRIMLYQMIRWINNQNNLFSRTRSVNMDMNIEWGNTPHEKTPYKNQMDCLIRMLHIVHV